MDLQPYLSQHLLAAQLLAYTVRQLLPTAVLVRGGLHAFGFYYDFIFEQPLNTPLFEEINRALVSFIKEKQPVRFRSMMRENAQVFLEKQNELFLALFVSEDRCNIVDLIEINELVLPCSELPLTSTDDVGIVKLLHYQPHTIVLNDSFIDVIRMIGVTRQNQQDLKLFTKNYETFVKKGDHRIEGSRQALFSFCDGDLSSPLIWREKGCLLLQRLAHWLKENKPWSEEGVISSPSAYPLNPDRKDISSTQSYSWILHSHLTFLQQIRFDTNGLTAYRLNERGISFESIPEPLQWGLLGSSINWIDQTTILTLFDHVVSELISSLQFIEQMFRIFSFKGGWYLISSRTKTPKAGRENEWLKLFKSAIGESSLYYPLVAELEGDTYNGPRLEWRACDDLGRWWTLSKIEIILHHSEALKVVNSQAKKERLAILSRQVLSFSQLVALLIEKNGGALPLWLVDEQIRVIPIGKTSLSHAQSVHTRLQKEGFRSTCEISDAPLASRIDEAEHCGVPFLALIGDREREKGGITLRAMARKEKTQWMHVEDFIETHYRQTQPPRV